MQASKVLSGFFMHSFIASIVEFDMHWIALVVYAAFCSSFVLSNGVVATVSWTFEMQVLQAKLAGVGGPLASMQSLNNGLKEVMNFTWLWSTAPLVLLDEFGSGSAGEASPSPSPDSSSSVAAGSDAAGAAAGGEADGAAAWLSTNCAKPIKTREKQIAASSRFMIAFVNFTSQFYFKFR
jgi:hypothetical protein